MVYNIAESYLYNFSYRVLEFHQQGRRIWMTQQCSRICSHSFLQNSNIHWHLYLFIKSFVIKSTLKENLHKKCYPFVCSLEDTDTNMLLFDWNRWQEIHNCDSLSRTRSHLLKTSEKCFTIKILPLHVNRSPLIV